MCRKHSGSLLPQNISFPVSHVSPPLTSNSSYKTYKSGPNSLRGFCSTCGSSLSSKYTNDAEFIGFNIGAFDEEVLIGEKVEEKAWEDEHGKHVPRKGGWGYVLGIPKYHIFAENEVVGVTDGFDGKMREMKRG
ncbi:hypothetical protein N0V90_003665 [Kalmusia sp. IMI 367209]|nr:hypothetical protein N0V90_003665 [Kalmusia sp. IMI 367209]